jgi:cytochrome c556
MKRWFYAIVLTTLVTAPFTAQAQFAKPEDAVKYRQSVMTLQNNHLGRVGVFVRGDKPYDKAALEADVAILEVITKLAWPAFTPGSDLPNSKAKPEIWKEQDKFKAASDKLQADVGRLSAAAKAGDLGTIKTAFGAVGQSCKACHDAFRK